MFDTIEAAILGHLNTQWGSTTAVAWPNAQFNSEDQKSGANKSPWIRPTIIYDSARNVALGAKVRRYFGTLIIQVFVGRDAGTQDMRTHTRSLHNIFKNLVVGGVHFRVPHISGPIESNENQAGGWYQQNVSVDFHYDDAT